MKWNILKTDEGLIQEYMNQLNVSEVMARVLINRDVDYETAHMLLNDPAGAIQDPMLMINVKEAALEIIDAIENNAEIWVFADYDVDGLTSGFVMTDFLRKTTNNEVHVYYPDRVSGYGLNMNFCKQIKERKDEEGIAEMLVITVDNGTSCIEEVAYLKEHGIRVLVTDHHMPKAVLPNCTIVNPHINDNPRYHHLCGCAVAYKTIQAIEQLVQMDGDYTSQYLFAVAFGTIADVMPMTPENIGLIKLGLEQVNSKDCPRALGHFKDYIGKRTINPSDVAWEVAPRLNACGRMGDIDKGAMLLFLDDDDQKDHILDVIIEIEELNEERKALTKRAMKQLSKENFEDDNVCVFDASDYPGGIAGIIAGRMTETYGKISLVVSGEDILVGSARSPQGYNLQDILGNEVSKGNLLSFGGHEMAAGFSLKAEKLFDLKESLNKTMEEIYASLGDVEIVEPTIDVDCIVDLKGLNKAAYTNLNELPYDRQSFPSPVVALTNLEVISWKASKNNESNINLTVKDKSGKTMSIWAWKMGETYKALGAPKLIDMAGKIDQNFMKKSEYTLNVMDIRKAVS